jgi:hypothetical protein
MATQIHGKIQFVDLNGVPLNGGKVYVYSPGTTTDKVSYTVPAATGGTENTQPVVLNARGEANIYVIGDCKITVTDSLDNLIYTLDNVRDLEYDLAASISASLAASAGSSLVGFIQSGTSAVARTVQAKERDIVSVKDFGAVGNGVTDDTAEIQAAITAMEAAGGGKIYFPSGTYVITSALSISGAYPIQLIGTWASIISNTGTGVGITCGNTSADQTADVRIVGLMIAGNALSSHGIHFKRMHSANIDRVRSKNNGGDGIRYEGCYASKIMNSYSNNNTGNGIYALGHASAGNDFIHIHGNYCLSNGQKGIYIDNTPYGPVGQNIELNDMEGNTIGFQIDIGSTANTEGFVFRSNYMENNTGANAVFGNDGGTTVLNSPTIQSNNFMFGTVSAAVNCVTVGAAIRGLNFIGNNLSTSNLTLHATATVGVCGGNKSNATLPTGFANDGSLTVGVLKLYQSGGGATAAIDMSGDMIRLNYPTQWSGGAVFPPSANTSTYQTACGLWAGTGAPNNSYGQNGDYYFRSDTPGTANQRLYVKSGGTWAGIL